MNKESMKQMAGILGELTNSVTVISNDYLLDNTIIVSKNIGKLIEKHFPKYVKKEKK